MENKSSKKFEQKVRVNVLPNNDELEKTVLGAIMSDPDAANVIFGKVSEDDFYIARNKIIFNELAKRSKENLPCDYTAVAASLTEDVKDSIGGYAYLTEVASSFFSSATYEQNVGLLKKLSQLRKMIKVSDSISSKAYNNEDAMDVIGFAQDEVYKISNESISKDLVPVSETTFKVIDQIIDDRNNGDVQRGLSTGFKNLDMVANGGFLPGQMIVLAARPGCGKTSYAMNIVANIARSTPEKVIAVFNLEMAAEELVKRLIATYAEVDSKNVSKSYNLTDAQMNEIFKAKGELVKSNIYIDDSSNVSADDIFFKSRRLRTKKGRLDLILIDHMQLIADSNKDGRRGSSSRYELMTNISRMIKIMAKELGVPVLVLSQMSRNIEKNDEGADSTKPKEPKMSDLRESGAIEQDADMVLFLTPGDFKIEDESVNRVALDVLVAKNRSGEAPATLHYVWQKDMMRFEPKEHVTPNIIDQNSNKKQELNQITKEEVDSNYEEPLYEEPVGYSEDSDFVTDLQDSIGLMPPSFSTDEE